MKKKNSLLFILLMYSLTMLAQKDITKFMGIPVDGLKKDMIQKLKAKGFEYDNEIDLLIFKREFPCLQAGDDSVSFRLSFGLQYIFLLFLPIYDQRTLQNRILSRGMVNDYATMEIRSAGRRMNIPSTD